MKKILYVVLFSFFIPSFGYAVCTQNSTHVWTAASCSRSDVYDCTSNASVDDGDTINIPACTATAWEESLSTAKGISLVGAGTNSETGTNIQYAIAAHNANLINFTGNGKTVEISNIRFIDQNEENYNSLINVSGSQTNSGGAMTIMSLALGLRKQIGFSSPSVWTYCGQSKDGY